MRPPRALRSLLPVVKSLISTSTHFPPTSQFSDSTDFATSSFTTYSSRVRCFFPSRRGRQRTTRKESTPQGVKSSGAFFSGSFTAPKRCGYLPITVTFHAAPELDKEITLPTPPDDAAVGLKDDKPQGSTAILPSRPSAANLLAQQGRPPTPNEEFFFSSDSKRRYFATPGDPQSLVQSEGEVPAWERELVYNQPRSRVAPLPSASILDYDAVHEQLKKEKGEARKKSMKSPATLSRQDSRATDGDGSYDKMIFTVGPSLLGNGGLTNALRSVSKSGKMEISWFGMIGFGTNDLPRSMKARITDHLLNEHQSSVIFVSDVDWNRHYLGYCKTILQPIFAYQVPDSPNNVAYLDHSYEFYKKVCQAFADKIVDSYKRGDSIWVHDYHLLLVPGMIRKKLPDAQIGFFLHNAFPSSEVFRCLSKRNELLEGVLGANLVAFQTDEYAQHFLQTCARLLTLETTANGVQIEDRFVNVSCHPIGISPVPFQEARQTDEVKGWITTLLEKYKDKMIIVGRDKLDDVHGIRQKLHAYEVFLNKNPQWKEKTVYIQVATAASESNELLAKVTDICARIDRNHSSLAHQPLVFLKQDIDFPQYFALLAVADVLMVSPLREGMNLQAHEYVLCQDGAAGGKKHGVLILSEFTGSAAVLKGYLAINPWDYGKMAASIKTALEMGPHEKEIRWKRMNRIVTQQNGDYWVDELAKDLAKVHEEHTQRASSSIPRLAINEVSEKYKQAGRRLFIIDFEGTLGPQKTSSVAAFAQPHHIIDTLNNLMADPDNVVYVMSGSQPDQLESVFRLALGVGLIAENGCFIREYGAATSDWVSDIDLDAVNVWKRDVKRILKYYNERMDGSYIEELYCSLVFRYEKVEDQGFARASAGECTDQVNSGFSSTGIQAIPIQQAIIIEQVGFTKATAAEYVLETMNEDAEASGQIAPEFVMVAGDDRDDEVVFRWANDLAKEGKVASVFTVSVGNTKRNTQAQAVVTQGSTGFVGVLQKLAAISRDKIPVEESSVTRGRPV